MVENGSIEGVEMKTEKDKGDLSDDHCSSDTQGRIPECSAGDVFYPVFLVLQVAIWEL